MRPAPAAGRSETVDLKLAWFVEKRYTAKAFCKNWGCERVKLDGTAPNGILLDLELYDQAMTDRELVPTFHLG